MQGNTTVLDYLDRYLQTELRGQRQYLRNARYCKHWGFQRLARVQDAYAEEETRHAAHLADRLLFLEGVPTFDGAIAIPHADSCISQLEQDRDLVSSACQLIVEAVAACEAAADYSSRDLLRDALADEENHLDWLETELSLVREQGVANYLQAQLA